MEVLLPTTVQENTELGCQVVEKIAMEKVSIEIDEVLAAAYMARRRQREQGLPWNDMSQYSNQRYTSLLPDGLRLHPGMPQQVGMNVDLSRVNDIPVHR
jgi:CCR4-NOT transcription complex subunit 1